MNRWLIGLCVPTLLSACSAAPKGPNVTLLVQKPNGADDSCLGIVGFEVEVSAAGTMSHSGTILSAAAVQTMQDCRLARPFALDNLDIERPTTVVVRGFDGAHHARISGSAAIESLHEPSATIDLKVEGSPPPPLILDRQTLLGGSSLAEVDVMTIATAKGQPVDLLSVKRSDSPAFFDVEPGGFGVEVSSGQELTIGFTFLTPGKTLPKQRVITTVDNAGPVFRVQ